jgi:hypothetical protein
VLYHHSIRKYNCIWQYCRHLELKTQQPEGHVPVGHESKSRHTRTRSFAPANCHPTSLHAMPGDRAITNAGCRVPDSSGPNLPSHPVSHLPHATQRSTKQGNVPLPSRRHARIDDRCAHGGCLETGVPLDRLFVRPRSQRTNCSGWVHGCGRGLTWCSAHRIVMG